MYDSSEKQKQYKSFMSAVVLSFFPGMMIYQRKERIEQIVL